MSNIHDYIKYYSDKSFSEVSFNEVDAAILSHISYIDFSSVKNKLPLKLHDASKLYFEEVTYNKIRHLRKIYINSRNTLNLIKDSLRYKNIILLDYTRIINNNMQFGAMAFLYENDIYISFEGTNEYISGWKEDFDMAVKFPIPSQETAINYLNNIYKKYGYFKKIYLMGHSKGGNLAVVAGAFTSRIIQNKIVKIYDFDGPGVRLEQFNSSCYQRIISRIQKYIPEDSIVGVFLHSKDNVTVMKSTSYDILQHQIITWMCFGSYFIKTNQSNRSKKFQNEIAKFLDNNSEDDLKSVVDASFEIFRELGIDKFEMISINKIIEVVNYLKKKQINAKTKKKLIEIFNLLI